MNCSESECLNECRFVCTCDALHFLCLAHLYYHSETCTKEKKTWDAYFNELTKVRNTVKDLKQTVLISAQKLILSVQTLTKKFLSELDKVCKNFKIFEEAFKRDLNEKMKKFGEKVANEFNKCKLLIDAITDQRNYLVTRTKSLSELFESMNIDEQIWSHSNMSDFYENCSVCLKTVKKMELDLINCAEDCKACIPCRKLDTVQCVICNRFYTQHEFLLLTR